MPTLKVILALLFAAAGIGIAGYTVMGSGEKNSSRDREHVITAVDDEGNAVDPNYTKARSAKQVDAVSDQIATKIQQLAPAVNAIASASGIADNSVARTTVDAISPILAGDHNGFLAAIKAMGGKITDLDGEHPLFSHLTKVFKHASVDVDRITVSKYTPPERGSRMVEREVVDEDVESSPSSSMRERVMQMRPESLFPDAPGVEDDSAIEVRIPMKPKDEDAETIFSLILTWNKEARLWQPATYGVIKRELVLEDDG